MKNHSFLLLLSILCCSIGITPAWSQTIVDSDISSDTTWTVANSPYRITESIQLDSGVVWTIDPGVTITVDTLKIISLYGTLIAHGTETDTIHIGLTNGTLTGSYNPDYQWFGFNLLAGAEIQLQYVKGSRARRIVNYVNGGHPAINSHFKHCFFTENLYGIRGLNAGNSSVSIDSCLFTNTDGPIFPCDNVAINHCTFNHFNTPVVARNSRINGCTFLNDYSGALLMQAGGELDSCYFDNPDTTSTFYSFDLELPQDTSLGLPTLIRRNVFHTPEAMRIYGPPGSPLTIEDNEFCSPVQKVAFQLYYNQPINLANNCWCEQDIPSIIQKIQDDSAGQSAPFVNILPLNAACDTGFVYPGDTNHDQVVDHLDIFPIGLHHAQTGPPRAYPSNDWFPHFANPWGDSLASTGVDIKHADSNGDGTINKDDTLAIHTNFSLTHTSTKTTHSNGIPLSLDMSGLTIKPGDTARIPIHLGSTDIPANEIYGLAFSLEYDSTIVLGGMAQLSFQSSWLGTKGTDMISFMKEHAADHQIDMSMVRTNQINQSGMGQIGEILLAIDANAMHGDSLRLSLSNVFAIDAEEAEIPLVAEQVETITLDTTTTTTTLALELFQRIHLRPNPVSDQVSISLDQGNIQSIRLLNLSGQMLYVQADIQRQQISLDVQRFPAGIYLLNIHTSQGEVMKKLAIHR
ncbi:MAG: T9SS type A sorting domain-containing protein [Bacteroidota bacterium]